MIARVERWIKTFIAWSKAHPILAGLVTFIPVLTVAGIMRLVRGGKKKQSTARKFSGAGLAGKLEEALTGKDGKGAGLGFDEFRGFGGTKAGAVEGVLKTLQLLV